MRNLIVVFFMFASLWSYSQIEISKESSKKEKKSRKEFAVSDSSYTEVLLGSGYGLTNRLLIVNEGLFGDSLGQKANEVGINTWFFSLAIRNRFHPNFAWTGGIRLLQNGESYRFEDVDTLYAYRNKYTYVSMPIRLEFIYGKRFGVNAGIGIEPQMLSGFKRTFQYKDSLGTEQEEESTSKDGLNSFVFGVNASIGVYYCVNKHISIHLTPEYRRQLTSSFDKYAPQKHFAYAWGVQLLLGYKF